AAHPGGIGPARRPRPRRGKPPNARLCAGPGRDRAAVSRQVAIAAPPPAPAVSRRRRRCRRPGCESGPKTVARRRLLERGFDLVSGGTDNHLLLVDLTSKAVTGKVAAQALDRARITVNYNTVPFDPRKPFDPSGIRIGTPAATSRGMAPSEMEMIARWIGE